MGLLFKLNVYLQRSRFIKSLERKLCSIITNKRLQQSSAVFRKSMLIVEV
jgi:hypothetical protein